MSLPLVVSKEAQEDIEQALDWYASHRKALGQAFLNSLDACFQRILRQPEAYPAGYRSTRKAPLGKFPYLVLYQPRQEFISVIAVIHGHRHPRTWTRRVR